MHLPRGPAPDDQGASYSEATPRNRIVQTKTHDLVGYEIEHAVYSQDRKRLEMGIKDCQPYGMPTGSPLDSQVIDNS